MYYQFKRMWHNEGRQYQREIRNHAQAQYLSSKFVLPKIVTDHLLSIVLVEEELVHRYRPSKQFSELSCHKILIHPNLHMRFKKELSQLIKTLLSY